MGIDAGKNTGIAIYYPNLGEIILDTVTFWDCIDIIKVVNTDITIEIESPSHNKPVFITRFDKQAVFSTLKIAQDVGRVKRESELIIEYRKRNNIPYNERVPGRTSVTKLSNDYVQNIVLQKRIKAVKLDKKTDKYIPKITTNEHERDAFMLIFKYL